MTTTPNLQKEREMNAFERVFLNEMFVFVLILLNATLIFVQAYKLSPEVEHWLTLADDIMSVTFLLEAVVKARYLGVREYWSSNWNRFDIFLVLASLPSILLRVLPAGTLPNTSVLLVLRVFRVFKFFRFIKFFPQVEHIFKSAQKAVGASFMVLAGFFVFIFIMSILFCYMFREIAPLTFGNPILSYYNTFQVFTIEGWQSIPAQIDIEALKYYPANPADPTSVAGLGALSTALMRIMFIATFIIGGVFGLSIVNSIFVDAMVSNSNEGAEEDVEKIRAELNVLNAKLDQIIAATHAKQVDRNELIAQAEAEIEAEHAARIAAEEAEKERQRREYGK
jgi:voltage-gated sodium channel